MVELVDGGSVPREYTYRFVWNELNLTGEADFLNGVLCKRIENGIDSRCSQVMRVKPIMSCKIPV